jgi:hypothetical protein
MKTNIVEYFVKLLDGVPANGMSKVIELEQQILKDTLLHKRVSGGEVASVFKFCEFVKAVSDSDKIAPVGLPTSHIVCYKAVVIRLILAGEFPATALEQFHLTFRTG